MVDGGGLESTIGGPATSNRLGEFYATLDLGYKSPAQSVATGSPEWLEKVFASDDDFANSIRAIVDLGQFSSDPASLTSSLARLLETDSRLFVPLMFAFRQSRFTNADLVQMLFDQSRLDDPRYYRDLERTDDEFRDAARRVRNNRKWTPILVGLAPEKALLATYKKAISGYLTRPAVAWKRWQSRIRTDADVRKRIGRYVVEVLGIQKLFEIQGTEALIRINLRTTNVEEVKHQVGEYATDRVRNELAQSGFQEWDLEAGERDYRTVDRLAKRLPSSAIRFVSEVLWKEEKRFDFVLVNNSGLRFAIEVNYFTTSGSKIGEVVDHFIELNRDPERFFHLFYVTDGAGWFSYTKDVRRMLDEESARNVDKGTSHRFLVNLAQFGVSLRRAATEMLSESR